MIFGTKEAAMKVYQERVRAARKRSSLPGEFEDLKNEEIKRMRYAKRLYTHEYFKTVGPRFGLGLSFYVFKVLKEKEGIKRDILFYLEDFKIRSHSSEDLIIKSLKDLGEVMKKYGESISPNWRYMVNLETLGGYRPSVDVGIFYDDVKQWVSQKKKHTLFGSEEEFLKEFRSGIKEFFDLAPNVVEANEGIMSVEEFAESRILYGGSGTTQENKSLLVNIGGKLKKPRRSKWRTALSKSRKEVINMIKSPLFKDLQQTPKAIQKRETAKVRPVISSDDRTYLKMSYISSWLEVALKGHPKTTLFFSPRQRDDYWRNMATRTGYKSLWQLPLDQDRFDWQPNKKMSDIFLEEMGKFIARSCNKPKEYLEVLDLVRASFEIPIYVEVGSKKVRWESGILSGTRWTALKDTAILYGECVAVKKRNQALGIPLSSFKIRNVQGDDLDAECVDRRSVFSVVNGFQDMNFEINEGKFFVAKNRAEYLRMIAVDGKVYGYPARIVNAILWRDPINKEHVKGLDRLGEQLRLWNLLMGRAIVDLDKLMISDMANGNGLSKDEVKLLLSTPVSLGGLGFYINKTVAGMTLIPAKVSRTDKIVEGDVGLREDLSAWDVPIEKDKVGLPLLEVQGSIKVDSPFEIKKIQIPSKYLGSYISGGYVPLAPRSVKDKRIGAIGEKYVLSLWIKERRWDDILNVWMHEEDRPLGKLLFKKCSRTLFVKWLNGRLPYSIPVVRGRSPEQVSMTAQPFIQGFWQRVIRGRPGMNEVIKSAVSCERIIRAAVNNDTFSMSG